MPLARVKKRRTTLQGFNFPGIFAEIVAEENKPRSKQEILSLLQDSGDEFTKWLETLSDDFLGEQVGMPGRNIAWNQEPV